MALGVVLIAAGVPAAKADGQTAGRDGCLLPDSLGIARAGQVLLAFATTLRLHSRLVYQPLAGVASIRRGRP